MAIRKGSLINIPVPIDSSVAAYWKEHYDLTYIIQRDWPKIGNKLKGKIHIYVGDMDSYYLNNAVYSAEDMLKKLQNPQLRLRSGLW
jgi:hypothetical protein